MVATSKFEVTRPRLTQALRSPRQQIVLLDASQPTLRTVPGQTWAGLTLIAFAGSAIYGASLALVLPDWRPARAGAWLTASAGIGWCVFGPLLVVTTRRNPLTCAHACLISMAYGEGVLVSGAGVNAALRLTSASKSFDVGRLNLGIVGVSNVVMATVLARQLRAIGVPVRKSLLLWNVGLNGSGGIAFLALRRRLRGGGR